MTGCAPNKCNYWRERGLDFQSHGFRGRGEREREGTFDRGISVSVDVFVKTPYLFSLSLFSILVMLFSSLRILLTGVHSS